MESKIEWDLCDEMTCCPHNLRTDNLRWFRKERRTSTFAQGSHKRVQAMNSTTMYAYGIVKPSPHFSGLSWVNRLEFRRAIVYHL